MFVKNDEGKPPLSLVPRAAVLEAAKVLGYGATKYPKYNHLQGTDWSRYLDAALRHLYAWADREDTDPESGLSHLSHALSNLCILVQYVHEGVGTDDRRPAEPSARAGSFGSHPYNAGSAEEALDCGPWGHRPNLHDHE